jgi:NTE family protein
MYKPSFFSLRIFSAIIFFSAFTTSAQFASNDKTPSIKNDSIANKTFPNNQNRRPKVGIVLSGGGAKGLVHIGALKVLEEAGMPIDFIGGTSIGSIIGGLYSIGYKSDDIKSMVLSQDWQKLLTDKFPRRFFSAEEKQKEGKYFLPYPVNNGKFQLPLSLIQGQEIELLLTRLMGNARDISDFNKLPIPFFCVATDIENNHAVVLNSGYLPKAIRASMAIPTVFMPVNIDGKMLVDGGLSNNFPVDEIKKMGADIIIGVDVSFDPYRGNNLNSLDRIIEQLLFIHTVEDNLERRKMCSIVIQPQTGEFSSMSFDRADSLIKIGEQAARSQFGRIKALADSIKALGPINVHTPLPEKEFMEIKGIHVIGNEKVSRDYIIAKLNIPIPAHCNMNRINKAVIRLYGTMFFQKIDYKITHENNGDILTLYVIERSNDMFSIGINYNSDYKAGIFFNTSIYNFMRNGSKLSIDMLLGENPYFNATYMLFSGWTQANNSHRSKTWLFNYGLNLYGNNYTLFNYSKKIKISSFDYIDLSADLFAQTDFFNSLTWGFGIQHEYIELKPDINPDNLSSSYSRHLNICSYLKFDTYNRNYFATQGTQFEINVRYLTSIYNKNFIPSTLVDGSWRRAVPLTKKLSVIPEAFWGISYKDSVPEGYQYRIGGLETYYFKNAIPFIGHKFLEYKSLNCAIARCNVQYEIFSRNFIVLKINGGAMNDSLNNLTKRNHTMSGYGLTYGYNSLLGPIELTLMDSPENDLITYLNVGFRF